jgi:hypothetical protein
LNVALFVPLGFLLRSLFRRGIVVSFFVGFGLSLLIETTQLTGVWGLYSCAYRYFDVGDLITNTTGAVVGSALAAIVVRPRTDAIDPGVPRRVTVARRLLGMLVDWLAVTLLIGTIGAGVPLAAAVLKHPLGTAQQETLALGATLVAFAVQAVFVLGSGATLGERAVLLTGVTDRIPGWLARPVRLLAGIGGYILLTGWDLDAWAGLLALVSVVAVFVMRSRRGFAQWVSGMRVRDSRADDVSDPTGRRATAS